ncbi:MAG: pilus motility taxis protein HmpF [Microcystaceae cyanobacterium]
MKTELKLLACQHSDQTWSALPNEEGCSVETMDTANEGTLWTLRLINRQVQGTPELAAPELVRQLQKLSRLSEKLKDQQEEIEQWKQSLTYQSQELARREMEIDNREVEAEEKEAELKQIERQKHEVDQAWSRLENERQQLVSLQQRFGYLIDLAPDYSQKLQLLLNRFAKNPESLNGLNESLRRGLDAVQAQQQIFNDDWQEVNKYRQQISHQQQSLQQKHDLIALKRQEVESTRAELEKAKVQLAVEQNVLRNHQDTLRRLNSQLQTTEDLQNRLYRLASGVNEGGSEHKVDLEALERMPLGELEENINTLRGELDKLARFVNDQEEELTIQCQAVDELQAQLSQASERDRLGVEEELAEEQERKGMLDRTLVGQRHNLKERQSILIQQLQVLRRRQGTVDLDTILPAINLDPAIKHLEGLKHKIIEERNKLETDIPNLQQSLQQIQDMTQHLDAEQGTKYQQLRQEEDNWQECQKQVIEVQTKLTLYEAALQPLQDQLDVIRPQLESLSEVLLTA